MWNIEKRRIVFSFMLIAYFFSSVDCSEAGNGDLEIFVKNDKGRVPSFCTDNGRGIYNVQFTPYLKGPHYVSVNFNRAEIRGWLVPSSKHRVYMKGAKIKFGQYSSKVY